MRAHPADDGALWSTPRPTARRRRIRLLLIVVGVTIAVVLVVIQLVDVIDPPTVSNHAGNSGGRSAVHELRTTGTGQPNWFRVGKAWVSSNGIEVRKLGTPSLRQAIPAPAQKDPS